jgi:hypothetical protein
MSVRNPKPGSAARILVRSLAELGISLKHRQALELIAKVQGYQNYHAMVALAEPTGSVRTGSAPPYKPGMPGECSIDHGNITVRVAAEKDWVWVGLCAKGHELDVRASARLEYAEAADDKTALNPSKPFYGCALPLEITALEFVSSDPRAREWSHRCRVQYVIGFIADWLEEGMPNNDCDVYEVFIEYADGGKRVPLTSYDLLAAKLDVDGRFAMIDGREFYFIDERGLRWVPSRRV